MSVPSVSRRSFLLGAGAVLLTAGCSGGRTGEAASTTGPAPGYPRTVQGLGDPTVVPDLPTRVVALSDFADLDHLLSLGVQPVLFGFTDSWGTGLMPWQVAAGADAVPQTDGSQINAEVVVGARPDLIVGMPVPLADQGDLFRAMAPTIQLGWDTPWRDGLTTVATAVGREERAATLIAGVDAEIAATAGALSAVGAGSVMVASVYGDVLYVQGDASPAVSLFRELGLQVLTTGPDALVEYSLERTDVLADAHVILSFATNPEAVRAAQASTLWRNLPAVQAGRYTAIDSQLSRGLADGFNALSYTTVLPATAELVTATFAGNGRPLT